VVTPSNEPTYIGSLVSPESIPAGSTPTAAPARLGRVGKTLLAVGLAGGIAVGGAAAAYADSGPLTPSAPTTPSNSAGAPTAPAAPGKHGHGRGGPGAGGFDGRITTVNGSGLTVADQFGQTRTFPLTSTTVIHQGLTQGLPASALAVGEHVHVRTQPTTTPSSTPGSNGNTSSSTGGSAAVDVDLVPAHVDGVVTADNGAGLTVVDPDGFTHHITATSATIYSLGPNSADGAGGTVTPGTSPNGTSPNGTSPNGAGQNGAGQNQGPSIVHPGGVIHALGRVDNDGTTLSATHITVRTAPVNPTAAPAAPGS